MILIDFSLLSLTCEEIFLTYNWNQKISRYAGKSTRRDLFKSGLFFLLPQHFRNNGYFTECVGKIFHNWRQDIHGDPQSWSVPQFMHYARHDDDQPKIDGKPPGNEIKLPRSTIRDVPDEAYFDGRIATRAIESLQRLKKNRKPFFLAVGFWKPHLPFNAPKRYWNLYDPAKVKLPPYIVDTMRVREDFSKYLAEITYYDSQVGEIMTLLDKHGLADNTLVIFTSDNGIWVGLGCGTLSGMCRDSCRIFEIYDFYTTSCTIHTETHTQPPPICGAAGDAASQFAQPLSH